MPRAQRIVDLVYERLDEVGNPLNACFGKDRWWFAISVKTISVDTVVSMKSCRRPIGGALLLKGNRLPRKSPIRESRT